jgi:3'-phosphoadenosine 5'-phosphosulfate sulfotransferase (PAPS reductase)/FAD synthetase
MNVLQFSGGVDSLACLILVHDMVDLHVLTASTDGAYPERAQYLAQVRAAFPQLPWTVVETQRDLATYGRPVDVVPLRYTAMGQLVRGVPGARYQDAFSCCHRAIWAPLDVASKRLGATTIIRGQRADDSMRAPLADGDVREGVRYSFPIQGWTRDRVLCFVEAQRPDLVPASYRSGERTSRDCMDCTAYLHENQVRIENLPRQMRGEVQQAIGRWRDDVMTEMEAAQ